MSEEDLPRHDCRRRRLGRLGEELAARHLERLGYSLLDRNHRTRFGEIDLVAYDGATLAFVEVKTHRTLAPRSDGGPRRASPVAGSCADELGWPRARPRRRLRGLALAWLYRSTRRPTARAVRFDVISVVVGPCDELVALEHLEGAM